MTPVMYARAILLSIRIDRAGARLKRRCRAAIHCCPGHLPQPNADDGRTGRFTVICRRRSADQTHQREQARFAFAVQRDTGRALELARSNFAVQREPADARILLESAIAAGDPKAAQPALDWLRDTGIEAPQLLLLAKRASTDSEVKP
jgi:hypothetical protein